MLTMLQEGAAISGFYKCATGTMMCRQSNEAGTISNGWTEDSAVSFRVMMPDVSSCIFTGIVAGRRMKGSYICLSGAAFIERGRWWVLRSY